MGRLRSPPTQRRAAKGRRCFRGTSRARRASRGRMERPGADGEHGPQGPPGPVLHVYDLLGNDLGLNVGPYRYPQFADSGGSTSAVRLGSGFIVLVEWTGRLTPNYDSALYFT